MKKKLIANERFIERDFEYMKILKDSRRSTYRQIQQILDGKKDWQDITLKLFSDGSSEVIDNNTGQEVEPRTLTGECLQFYVLKKMKQIGMILESKKEQERSVAIG
jgi:hypothetical protein